MGLKSPTSIGGGSVERKGAPGIVEQTLIRPPSSQLGPISPTKRDAVIAASPVADKYENKIDRDSAFERLWARAKIATEEVAAAEHD
ncbi:MAG: helicase HerA-like domain-containing protein [Paracoccaceae bacterium]